MKLLVAVPFHQLKKMILLVVRGVQARAEFKEEAARVAMNEPERVSLAFPFRSN